MGYVQKHLLDGESIVYMAHLHWVIYIKKMVPWTILCTLVGALIGHSAIGVILGIPVIIIAFIAGDIGAIIGFLLARISIVTSEFAVTNHRVLIKVGFIRRNSLEIVLRQVEGIGVDQGIVGRMFGFGQITISGTGATKGTFDGIANPLEFRKYVQSLTRG